MLTRDGRHRPLLWEPTTGRRCALFIFIFSGFLCVLFLASCFLLWEPTTGRRCAHRLLLCPFLVLFRSFSCLLLLGCFESESHLAFSRYFQVFLLPASSWLLRSRIAPGFFSLFSGLSLACFFLASSEQNRPFSPTLEFTGTTASCLRVLFMSSSWLLRTRNSPPPSNEPEKQRADFCCFSPLRKFPEFRRFLFFVNRKNKRENNVPEKQRFQKKKNRKTKKRYGWGKR